MSRYHAYLLSKSCTHAFQLLHEDDIYINIKKKTYCVNIDIETLKIKECHIVFVCELFVGLHRLIFTLDRIIYWGTFLYSLYILPNRFKFIDWLQKKCIV